MTDHKEVNMSRAEQERQEVGLTPEEVREINRTKESKSKSRSRSINAAANVLAASLTAAGGTGLVATAQEALNSTPSPIVQEQRPDPKRDIPPAGVVFPENIRADGSAGSPQGAPVEPVLTRRVFALFGPPDALQESKSNIFLYL